MGRECQANGKADVKNERFFFPGRWMVAQMHRPRGLPQKGRVMDMESETESL